MKEQERSVNLFALVFLTFFTATLIGVHIGSSLTTKTGQELSVSQWKEVEMEVTAYCPCSKCCGKWADGITASGHKIAPGDKLVAADRSIPFGTMIVIPGYNDNKPVPVLDRGGVIKGNKLDVYFDTHQEALNWGRQHITVKVGVENE